MYKPQDYKHVFDQLKIPMNRAVSLYKYAPVFKVRINDNFYVLKKTKEKEKQVNKLVVFQKHLDSLGINVSIPLKRFDEDTHLIGEERWVIYPFVEGSPYNGSDEHIVMAGELLGKVHAANNHLFNHGFTWKTYEDVFFTDILDDIKTIESTYGDKPLLRQLVESSIANKLNHLKEIDFPFVDATWDYKASNLIYNEDLTLIDLDNSGYVPRIFDLALALLLFHTDASLAPDRPLSPSEWKLFMEGYKKHCLIEDIEKEHFVDYLKFVFLDEGFYAIVDLDDDEPERQKNFMKNLLEMDFDAYSI